MEKRGLNDIITTLLIILLSFASVVILWVVAKAFILESAESIDTGQFTTSFTIPGNGVMVNDQLGIASIIVRREAGDTEVAELNIILKDESGAEKNFIQDLRGSKFDTYESKKFEVSYLGSTVKKLKSISLSATLKNQDGKEIKGNSYLAYEVKGNEKLAGMVLWLDFESGDFKDKSGWGNTVIPKGSITSPADESGTGRASKALTFDGRDDALEIANAEHLNFGTGSFSIAFWAKPSTQTATGGGRVIDKSSGAPPMGYYSLFGTSNPVIISAVIIDGTDSASPQYDTVINEWRLYVLVYDKSNSARKISTYVFNRGGRVTGLTLTGSEALTNVDGVSNTANLFIGSNSAGIANRYLGKLDDVMIFNRALSSKEVDELYSRTKQ